MQNGKVWKDHLAISMPGSPKSPKSGVFEFLTSKIAYFKRVVQDTVLAIQQYRSVELIGQNDFHSATTLLQSLFDDLCRMKVSGSGSQMGAAGTNAMLGKCQKINDELASIFRVYGTRHIDDLITICLQNDYLGKHAAAVPRGKLELLRRHLHPLSYKTISWRSGHTKSEAKKTRVIQKTRIVDDAMIVENAGTMDCFDLCRTSKVFHTKVHGIRVALQDSVGRKTLIVNCLVDDLSHVYTDNPYIRECISTLEDNVPQSDDFASTAFEHFVMVLSLKELLVYSCSELHDRFAGYMNQVRLFKQKSIAQIVREFMASDLYAQRTTLVQLLLRGDDNEYQYLAYLLYDLLSSENNGVVDSRDQVAMFDSFPWPARKYFKDAMKQTIRYTETLSSFDSSRIPLEQQICLMKASDAVKEKAMLKLKEVKSKSEDSGSKARQFLEGLLRIPFGIYKMEPILTTMGHAHGLFRELRDEMSKQEGNVQFFDVQERFTSVEMNRSIRAIKETAMSGIAHSMESTIVDLLTAGKRNAVVAMIHAINAIIKDRGLKHAKLTHSGRNMVFMRDAITSFAKEYRKDEIVWNQLIHVRDGESAENDVHGVSVPELIKRIEMDVSLVTAYLQSSRKTLDDAVYGHERAKRQIERILGQWVNGENTGYCFGFEGPPGVGKTSLAKRGIAHCLQDGDGLPRPFSFVPIGGSSNGSTLEGHNYTYVGSTWGRIVDIVIESKCMNPIIFIDELDKVSNTEHGKEIIGILTHLIDPTQNTEFSDKYFSGIDLDMSKALFIFSYNDPRLIDRILLDRIHRVCFEHLTVQDKLVITRDYMWPEVLGKVGLSNMVVLEDDTVEALIDEYTCEPGVRKLKELLFEIAGEVNLACLHGDDDRQFPITLAFADIQNTYLRDKRPVRRQMVASEPAVGLVNGMWANAMGQGGVLPIEAHFFPASGFLELKLTGMQGDVMKESMNVALTVAWGLLSKAEQTAMRGAAKKPAKGIHIHCPEGATPKDGPSAGAAITLAMYSLFSGRPVNNLVAMTGEIDLRGNVTAIGGLDLKILGGVRAGATTFAYPVENKREHDELFTKYGDGVVLQGIVTRSVSNIREVIDLALA